MANFNTFVLYIEENENSEGELLISAEAFGEPQGATELGAYVIQAISEYENVRVVDRSTYTSYPPTEYAQ